MISADKALQDALAAATGYVGAPSEIRVPHGVALHVVARFLESLPGGGIWFASGAILQPKQLAQHLRTLGALPPVRMLPTPGFTIQPGIVPTTED